MNATMNCIAYNDDGTICEQPGVMVDEQRGGAVCAQHKPKCATIVGIDGAHCPAPVAYKVTTPNKPGWFAYECEECAASRREFDPTYEIHSLNPNSYGSR